MIDVPVLSSNCPSLPKVSVPLPRLRAASVSSPELAKKRQVLPASDLLSSTAVTSTVSGVPSES